MKEPLLRIHIDDISNVEPVNIKSLSSNYLLYPTMYMSEIFLYQMLMESMRAEIENDSMHIIIPAGLLCSSYSINFIFSMGKGIIEGSDADLRPHGDEKAIDMHYDMVSCRLYWDSSHTNKAVILGIRAEPLSMQDTIQERITQIFGDSIILNDNSMMLIDAHGEYDAVMGRITRICDMLSYEMSSTPDIYNDKYRYLSGEGGHYISIIKPNP